MEVDLHNIYNMILMKMILLTMMMMMMMMMIMMRKMMKMMVMMIKMIIAVFFLFFNVCLITNIVCLLVYNVCKNKQDRYGDHNIKCWFINKLEKKYMPQSSM